MKTVYSFVSNRRYWQTGALICLSTACLLGLGACSGEEAPADRTAMLPENERVSSVPWNKPQGWENQGALGSLANDPRLGGQGYAP
jgi:hypothetical protein